MYYDFFCNENMLLAHYDDYRMSDHMLKRLLIQSGMPPDRCADMFLARMENKFQVEYDRYDLIKWFQDKTSGKNTLRNLDKIVVYKQDLDFMKEQIRKHNMGKREQLCMFGVIVMCRINDTDTLDLTTDYKIKQFCGCFDKRLWTVVYDSGMWYEAYHAPVGMEMVSDVYNILKRKDSERKIKQVGCYYTYENFKLTDDEVAYEMVVTPNTNRLNLSKMFGDIGLENIRYCACCGKAYYSSCKTALYCGSCRAQIKKNQTRERVRRYREKVRNKM